MILTYPEGLQGKALLQHLHTNKADLIKAKKVGLKFADPVCFGVPADGKAGLFVPKAKAIDMVAPTDEDPNLRITVVANMSGWMDSQDDVLLRGCYDKTLRDKGIGFPFLRDHRYSIEAIIAKTEQVYTRDFTPMELGITTSATANPQGLIFVALLTEDIGDKAYWQYKDGLINQHSIGLRYIRIDLAINDPDFPTEFKTWNQFKGQVLNIQEAEEQGFFWAVQEIELIENSAVVFASNILTPTLVVEEAKTGAVIDTPKAEAEQFTSQPKKVFSHYNLF